MRNKLLLILTVIIIIISFKSIFAQTVEIKNAEALFNEGNLLFNQGKYNEALAEYKRAFKLNPKKAEIAYNIGVCYLNRGVGWRRTAESWFKKAIELKEDLYLAYYNLGFINFKRKNYEKAEKYFLKALEINKEFSQARLALSEVKEEKRKKEELKVAEVEVKKIEEEKVKEEKKISIDLRDADILSVLKAIAEKAGVNIVAHEGVKGKVTVSLKDVSLKEALRVVLIANEYAYQFIDTTIFVATKDFIKVGEDAVTEVIKLEYADPVEVKRVLIDLKLGTESSIQIYQGGTGGIYTGYGGAPTGGGREPTTTEIVSGAGVLGTLQVSENTASSVRNILLVVGTKEVIARIKEFVKKIDTSPAQIIIEARIEDINTDATKDLGILWETGMVGVKYTEQDPGLVTGRIHTFARNALEINSTLQLLETKGKARSLARPKISTVDGKMAQIFIGKKFPIPVFQRDQYGNIVEGEAYTADSNVGIRLQIIPRITEGNEVSLDVITEVSSIVPGATGKLPIVNTRSTRNFIRMKDGETAILGGLLSKEEIRNISQIPILGDIPVLGKLFRGESKELRETELIIFITPKVLIEKVNLSGGDIEK